MDPVHLYLASNYDAYITHPYVTSCVADLSNLPPLLIQAGDAEVLRDEDTLLAQRAARAGVKVTHEIYEGGIHGSSHDPLSSLIL
jgi:acetyl esterase/lipase